MIIPRPLELIQNFLRRYVSRDRVTDERLIPLFWALIALILFASFYGLRGFTTRLAQELTTSKASLERLQREVEGDYWAKRLETTESLKSQLGARLWDAPTIGLAEAGFEAWIRNSFSHHDGTLQQVQITRSPAAGRDGQTTATMASIQRMTAKVLAPFDHAVLAAVLLDAAKADKIIVIDRLIVRAGTNARIEMDISTFVRTGDLQTGVRALP
jgi:hypothetical protein